MPTSPKCLENAYKLINCYFYTNKSYQMYVHSDPAKCGMNKMTKSIHLWLVYKLISAKKGVQYSWSCMVV